MQPDRLKEVCSLCQKAITLDPDFGLAYELLGIIAGGYAQRMAIDFELDTALNYYRRAIELDSTCDFALWQLATDRIDRGMLDEATALLEQAANLDTKLSTVYFLLATIYKGTRQFAKQSWAWEKAKFLSPNTVLSNEMEQKRTGGL